MEADHEGGEEATVHMWADHLIEVDADGSQVWDWHAYEHLDLETDIITP